MKNWHDLTPDDFPVGMPALKMKQGLWYRPNNCGYTNTVFEAGLYGRNEIIKYCFDDGKNGSYDVIGVPLALAMQYEHITKDTCDERVRQSKLIRAFLCEDKDDYSAIESLEKEAERFYKENSFNALTVTNAYVQAAIVIREYRRMENKIVDLTKRYEMAERISSQIQRQCEKAWADIDELDAEIRRLKNENRE